MKIFTGLMIMGLIATIASAQSYRDLFRNDLPQGNFQVNATAVSQFEQEMEYRIHRYPEHIEYTFQYLHDRYDRGIEAPDSNHNYLCVNLDRQASRWNDAWLSLQNQSVTAGDYSDWIRERFERALDPFRVRRPTSTDSVDTEFPISDENRNSYYLLKYYQGDSTLRYHPEIHYTAERNKVETEIAGKLSYQYDKLNAREWFDPDERIAEAQKYFFLFAGYHDSVHFARIPFPYADYVGRTLDIDAGNFRKTMLFFRGGLMPAAALYGFSHVTELKTDVPVEFTNSDAGFTGSVVGQAGVRIFISNHIRSLSFIEIGVLYQQFQNLAINKPAAMEPELISTVSTWHPIIVHTYRYLSGISVSNLQGSMAAGNIAFPVLFLSNRAALEVGVIGGIRRIEYDYHTQTVTSVIEENTTTGTRLQIESVVLQGPDKHVSTDQKLILTTAGLRYYFPFADRGPQLSASLFGYFGSAALIELGLGIEI